jgi:four helix bundle protein
MFSDLSKTASFTPAARAIFGLAFCSTTPAKCDQQKNVRLLSLSTTKPAPTSRTHFTGRNISKRHTGSVTSKRAAIITSRGKEGFERRTKKDFAHFLDLSKGSAGEVRSMLYLAEDRKYVDSATTSDLRFRYSQLSSSIGALAASLRRQG